MNDDVPESVRTLTHDAKSALTSIKAYTQILIRRFDKRDDPETADNLIKLDAKIDELVTIITQLATKVRDTYGQKT